MFAPSAEMLSHLPGIQPTKTLSRTLSRTKFWDAEKNLLPLEAVTEDAKEEEPSLCKEEIDKEIDRLKGRAMEVQDWKTIRCCHLVKAFLYLCCLCRLLKVEAVLRVNFDAPDCIQQCRAKLQQCSEFYENLGQLVGMNAHYIFCPTARFQTFGTAICTIFHIKNHSCVVVKIVVCSRMWCCSLIICLLRHVAASPGSETQCSKRSSFPRATRQGNWKPTRAHQ